MVRADGFVSLRSLLACPALRSFRASPEDVARVVHANNKQRFALGVDSSGEQLIRANQGHSMPQVQAEDLLRPLRATDVLPPVCVHGTYERHVPAIRARGLLAGGCRGMSYRLHVHFCPHPPPPGIAAPFRA